MATTVTLVLIAVTVLAMVGLTVAGIHYLREVLSEEEHDHGGHGGAAH